MDARRAGEALRTSLKTPATPFTLADAVAQSGLPIRDAESGLHWLVSEYRGHLRVTGDGDLLFLFPNGFTRPWQTRDRFARAAAAVGRGVAGVGRFVVRAWLTIVLFAYVGIFLAVLIALMFARSSSDSSSDRRDGLPGASLIGAVFRVLAEALFWTFHPFSPFAWGYYGNTAGYGAQDDRRGVWGREREREEPKVPFYEKVNRFVFGPTPPPEDPRAMEKRILAEIRAQKGRIGLADVMRVTGLPREQADPLMSRLMLDYEGEVEVSDEGGITYRFEALRKTTGLGAAAAEAAGQGRPGAAWATPPTLPPLTGNPAGSNVLIGVLNGFNAVMGGVALSMGLTVANVLRLFQGVPLEKLPWDGVPVALGVVPLVFSLLLFALPAIRAALRPLKARAVAKENGRLGVLREVLTRVETGKPVTEPALVDAYARAGGERPDPKELTRVVVEMGGDAEVRPDGELRYRFVDIETEQAALEVERREAPEREARVAPVVFGSDR